MKEFIVELGYLKGGERHAFTGGGTFEFGLSDEPDGFALAIESSELNGGSRYKVDFTPDSDVILKSFTMTVIMKYEKDDRVFCNGYQSWTDSREFMINERMKGLGRLMDIYYPGNSCREYGDYRFIDYTRKKGYLHSHSYTYRTKGNRLDFLGSLNERGGYTVFLHRTPLNLCVMLKDVDGAEAEAGTPYPILDIVELSGGYDEVFDKYFDMLEVPKPKKNFASGFTSWYNYYGNINEETMLENIKNIVDGGYGMDIFQIDDGHQSAIGDWLETDAKKFPNGMKAIADEVTKNGMTPGIWLAPLACVQGSKVFKEHQDWLVKGEDGLPYRAGNNWGGFYTLDIYNKDAADYIRNFFKVILDDWGYGMVKLDFLYQQCIMPRNGKSRGRLMDDAMTFIRDCVGDRLILGCGVPLFPAFGKVDFCRISCDVDHALWNGNMVSRSMHRENVSTKQAVFTSVYRRHLDGRAFVSDPDVFHLRPTGKEFNMYLNDEQKNVLARVNHMFGDILFTSDNVGQYGEAQRSTLRQMTKKWNGKIVSVTNKKPFIIDVAYNEGGVARDMTLNLKRGKLIKK